MALFLTLLAVCISNSASKAVSSSGNCGTCDNIYSEQHPEMEKESTCPPGLFCQDGYCQCGSSYPYFFSCNDGNSSIRSQHCATFDYQLNTVQVGFCEYNFVKVKTILKGGNSWIQLPSNSSLLNYSTCEKHYKRNGTLCGKCLPDHYPLAYSFNLTCVPCQQNHLNWLWYTMAAYLPLTVFSLLVLFFKINTTSSHFFAMVYYCQMFLSVPAVTYFSVTESDHRALLAVKVLVTLYGIWNLDFFRPFYSNLCLRIGILPSLALDYGIALYPLLLMILFYMLIELHDRNYRVITFMWHPFRRLFSLLRRSWNIRTSVIDAYATFFFLSNSKFLSVSFNLLAPVRVYSLYRDHSNYTWRLYNAANIEYFGREHLPYAFLAIAVSILCIILPVTALALYPFRCFQKFLALFPFRWFMLRTFMDSFHGCYKGTEPGTRDYRWIVAVFFITRLGIFITYYLTNSFLSLISIILILHTTLLATLQPFKSSLQNVINITFMQLLALSPITAIFIQYNSTEFRYFFYLLTLIVVSAPAFYASAIILHWIYSHRRFGLSIIQQIRALRQGYIQLPNEDGNLPDRIENSGDYPRENLANLTSPVCRRQ